MRLFNSDKVQVFLKAWSGATERAPKHGETKVVKVTFLIPLTSAVASALVPGDGEIKNTVFKAALDGSVRAFLRSQSFDIAFEKQKLEVFATPDSETPSIAFDHVKFSKVVSTKTVIKAAQLWLRATIGPCGPQEYGFLGMWHNTDRWVTFTEADPKLALDGAQPALADADEKARHPFERPEPESEDPRDVPAGQEVDRPRYTKRNAKKGRHLSAVPPVGPQATEEPAEDQDAAVSI